MTSFARLFFSLGITTLFLLTQGCGGSTGNGGKDASPNRPDADAAPDSPRDALPDSGGAKADGAMDGLATGDVPPNDATLVDSVVADAPIPSDGGVETHGTDALLPEGPLDASTDHGPGAEDAEGNSAEAGSVDSGATEVFADNFSCDTPVPADAGISERLCYDFGSPASASDFVPEAGTWGVANGTYTAVGPPDQVTCPPGGGTVMTASVLAGLSAKNVRVHARMTSISGVDKVLVLRSRPGGNRIEINFRANYVDNGQTQGGDLNVSDLVNCVNAGDYISVAGPNPILIPHAVLQPITVDVQLIDQQLTIVVDGRTVFDGMLPLSTTPGSVGFAVFRDAVVQFDDFLVDVLD
jgi:hypothetical protein